jgi:hypothetical protein
MRLLLTAVVLALSGEAALAQSPAAPVAARISDFTWLAGSWAGEGFGGQMEEVWSAPNASSMVGYFRLSQKGKPVFYEIMTLLEHEGSVEMRLKHVNPDMTGWEEKNAFQTFKLEKLDATGAYFDGLRLQRVDANTIDGTFIVRRGATVSEQKFVYKRAP